MEIVYTKVDYTGVRLRVLYCHCKPHIINVHMPQRESEIKEGELLYGKVNRETQVPPVKVRYREGGPIVRVIKYSLFCDRALSGHLTLIAGKLRLPWFKVDQ